MLDHIPRIDMHVHLILMGLLGAEACYKIIIIFINQNWLWLQELYSNPNSTMNASTGTNWEGKMKDVSDNNLSHPIDIQNRTPPQLFFFFGGYWAYLQMEMNEFLKTFLFIFSLRSLIWEKWMESLKPIYNRFKIVRNQRPKYVLINFYPKSPHTPPYA